MQTPSDVRRLVERALEKAIQLKIDELPNVDPKDVMAKSLAEFNKHFEGVYKIDTIKLTKDTVDISIQKDKDFYEGEEISV